MTQPAVTQHIKYLEQYYGTKLFYYDEKKRLHLTDQGRLLRSYAQSVQADSEIIKNRLSVPINEPDIFKLGSLTGFGDSSIGEYMEPATIGIILTLLGLIGAFIVFIFNHV